MTRVSEELITGLECKVVTSWNSRNSTGRKQKGQFWSQLHTVLSISQVPRLNQEGIK